MKRLIAAVLAIFPLAGYAQAKPNPMPKGTDLLYITGRTAAGGSSIFGSRTVTQPVLITASDAAVAAAGGGGAGTTVVTLTDGTNTCTLTFNCSVTNAVSTGAGTRLIAATPTNGAGTGCSFATGATVLAWVTTAGCTTTQPTLQLHVYARLK